MKAVTSIPNAKRTFHALRSLGYDLNSSVADLIDNSISANATKINVIFKRKDNGFYLRLSDNGHGMNEESLKEAMRLGTETEYGKGDLGKFGMGMKTASLSHCNRLTVLSKSKSSTLIGFRWDMQHISESNQWELIKLNKDDIDRYFTSERSQIDSKGTIVCWDNFFLLDEEYQSYSSDRFAENFYYRLQRKLKLHLRMIFHRFMDDDLDTINTLEIFVNGEKLNPWDPFCRDERHTEKVKLKKELSELDLEDYDTQVYIKGYVLPTKDNFSSEKAWKQGKGLLSWNDAQGYYIYRANRLIRFGGWQNTMAKDEHIKLARLSIDIQPELDNLFQVTVNKNKVQFPEVLYQHLKTQVNREVVKKAKKVYRKSPDKPKVTNSFRNKKRKVEKLSKGLTKEGNIKTNVDDVSETFDVEVSNNNGSWLSNRVQEFLEYGSDRDFEVISGEVENGHFWKILGNADEKFKVVVNEKHPFYSRIYESGKINQLHPRLMLLYFHSPLQNFIIRMNKTLICLKPLKQSVRIQWKN